VVSSVAEEAGGTIVKVDVKMDAASFVETLATVNQATFYPFLWNVLNYTGSNSGHITSEIDNGWEGMWKESFLVVF
jgi:hypothetical protein